MTGVSNLDNLLCEIERAYMESYNELKDFSYIPKVDSFLKRRKSDLVNFKNMTGSFNRYISVYEVNERLRRMLPKEKSKYYGGICLKGGEYFKVTKGVRKAVDEEIEELKKEAYENEIKEYESQLNFDKDFCIPDELDNETMSDIYE